MLGSRPHSLFLFPFNSTMNVLRLNPFVGLFLESVDTLAVKLGDLSTDKRKEKTKI